MVHKIILEVHIRVLRLHKCVDAIACIYEGKFVGVKFSRKFGVIEGALLMQLLCMDQSNHMTSKVHVEKTRKLLLIILLLHWMANFYWKIL